LRLLDLNADLLSARCTGKSIEWSYQNPSRALARLDRRSARIRLDGHEVAPDASGTLLVLPRGRHTVTVLAE
jgi:Zn-dependent protease with chaperone function